MTDYIIELENADDNWTKRIAANSVQITFSRNNNAEPKQSNEITDVIENTFENPTFNIQNWEIYPNITEPGISISDFVTLDEIQDLHTKQSTELYLTIKFGQNPTRTVSAAQPNYTDKIPVKVDNAQVNINSSESAFAGSPRGSITFIETLGSQNI